MMIKPEAVSASITRMLKGAAATVPAHLVREGVLDYLVTKLDDRNQLNGFIATLRARMRDKLKDGIQ